jgi:lysophospholipase L1-like esterase
MIGVRAVETRAVGGVLRTVIPMIIGAAGLCLLLEGGARCYLRVRTGHWPQTLAGQLAAGRLRSNAIFQAHPFLNVGPRPGTATTAGGRRMAFNHAGYRSPERETAKPPGAYRIVTAGGSTTFDISVPRDELSWPWQLEDLLAADGGEVEVWNAGFPGWTSLENTMALAMRDVDLQPDLLVLFQGVNDLQPAAHTPFQPDYAGFHARVERQATGIDEPTLSWAQRSVFLDRVLPVGRAWFGIAAPPPASSRIDRLPSVALRVFERNVRSFIAVGHAHGADTLLVTQTVRLRDGAPGAIDELIMNQWIPGLDSEAVPAELERLNDVLRRIAASGAAAIADAAREVAWDDADFADPMHFTQVGSRKLARYLASKVAALRAPS